MYNVRSLPLLNVCVQRGHQVFQSNACDIAARSNCFDAGMYYTVLLMMIVISIALVHHLSTVERRRRAIAECARIARVGAPIMIYVWALEGRKKPVPVQAQDQLVPWHLKSKFDKNNKESQSSKSADVSKNEFSDVLYRYYHLFVQGELEQLINSLDCRVKILESGYECENWYAVFEKVPWNADDDTKSGDDQDVKRHKSNE